MKDIKATVLDTKDKNILEKIQDKLKTIDWENMYWTQFSRDCVQYWIKWWHECDGIAAKTIQLVVHAVDRLHYVATSFMFGLVCALFFFT